MSEVNVGPSSVTEIPASCVLAGRRVLSAFGLGTVGHQLIFTFIDQEDATSMLVDRDTFLTALETAREDHANATRQGILRRRPTRRTVVYTSRGPLGVVADGNTVTLQAPFQVVGRSRWRTVRGPSHWTCSSCTLDEALGWSAAKDAETRAWNAASGPTLADQRH